MASKVMDCKGCRAHEFQDMKHGKGKRVFNKSGKPGSQEWSCTVCGNTTSSADKKKGS